MKKNALLLGLCACLSLHGQEAGQTPASLQRVPPATLDPQLSTNRHWAFNAPQRPGWPAIRSNQWVRSPIDAFVLARLENIEPSPEADRRTLIRRLSFDLLGLPPSPAEVEAFVQDGRSDAYELLVDRLLASPHFGERWGRHWLDLARYADSDGYEKDSPRPYAYLYRDWVIDAVNRDLPFDRFTIEQLAGDLLPNATEEQKIATGFHRNTLTNKEGGVDQEEYRCKATVDRVSTTGTVWLGLTIGCAECHSHKYDPISQREFYQLYAFFNNASEKDIAAPRPAELASYRKAKVEWDAAQARLKTTLAAYLEKDLASAQAHWEREVKLPKERWTLLEPKQATATNGTVLKIQNDRSIQVSGKIAGADRYTIETEPDLQQITGFRLEVFDSPAPATGGNQSSNLALAEFSVKVEMASSGSSDGSDKSGGPVAVALHRPTAFPPAKKPSVERAIDGDPATSWVLDRNCGRRHVAVLETSKELSRPAGAKLIFQLDTRAGSPQAIRHFRLSATSVALPLQADGTPDSIVRVLETDAGRRTESERQELAKYYREDVDPTVRKLNEQLAGHAKAAPKFPETKAQALVENDPPRKTHIHIRGDFLRPGDEVQPGTLAVLPPFKPRGGKADRLDLARWLFDPANPLMARVTVNRIWAHLFGRGLVTSLNDFGARGEKPSHPELLDWLATEFPRLGWSRKALVKSIVLSSTYRQSSRTRPELLERDPNNVLLARQNRFRLEAENVRDACLAVSGLLAPAIGGASVRPPLPADIAALGYADSVKWKESGGADRYRRGLYIFFQRTVPYPMLVTFDAPDSNATCTRRDRSNTPLQALTLLNDPVFFECAQALGRRLAQDEGTDPRTKLEQGFANCLARPPTPEELARLEKLYQGYLLLTRSHPEDAARIVGDSGIGAARAAETAAWIGVGRMLLNLDEFVTRE